MTRSVKGRGDSVSKFLRYLVLVLIALIFVFPIVFMLVSSLKPDLQLLSDTSSLRAFLPIGDVSLNISVRLLSVCRLDGFYLTPFSRRS
jgi:ABC-type glycerol-3-phosphate transport system permease component